jgi:hypothetical protein
VAKQAGRNRVVASLVEDDTEWCENEWQGGEATTYQE